LLIATPRRAGAATARELELVRGVVRASGIPSSRLRIQERSDGQSAMTLAFDRVAAVGPTHCHDWSDDMARRPEVGPWRNFGCFSQRNLAAMVADPTDLVAPAPETPRGSERRATIAREHATSVRVLQGAAEARR
jgi:pilus assembly protein CpaD